MSQQTQTKILRESLAKYLQLRKDEHLLWNQQKEKMWGHLANRVPTPLNHSPSSLRSYCSLGLFCGDYAEHIQPVVYLDFPTIAYQFLYAQGVEEKQRYSVDIKIKDTRNLSVSKKLNPPDSTLPSIELGWIPALHVGTASTDWLQDQSLLIQFRPFCSISLGWYCSKGRILHEISISLTRITTLEAKLYIQANIFHM